MWARVLGLVAGLAWLAAPAHAGPAVIAFVASAWTTTTAAFAAGGIFAGGTFLGIAARAVIALGMTALSRSLSQQTIKPMERRANYAQTASYMERSYGRVRKGGPFGFSAFKDNKRLYAVLLGAQQIDAVERIWLDKREVTLDGDGYVNEDPIGEFGRVAVHDGAPGQVADAWMETLFPSQITSAHDFEGLAYVTVIARRAPEKRFAKVYKNGREWVLNVLMRGAVAVYDPRSDSYGWTDNAALIIAAECLHFGKEVDWDEVAAEADICDEVVTNRAGGTQARWTINAIFDDSMDWETVRAQLALACDAFFYERPDGKVGFRVGRWIEPTLTLTAEDFIALQVVDGGWGPDVNGSWALRYIEPEEDWVEALSGAYVVDEAAPRFEDECYAINSTNQAARVCKALAVEARAKYRISGTIKPIGYEAIGERFIRVQHAELGLDIVIEVDKLIRNAGGLTFSLEGFSVSEADKGFDAATEEPLRSETTTVADDESLPEPSGLAGVAIEGTGGVAAISWTWPALPDGYAPRLQIEWDNGGTIEVWGTYLLTEGTHSHVTSGLVDGAEYIGRVAARQNFTGTMGDYLPEAGVSVVAVANSVPPAALAAFAVVAAGSTATVSLTAPNDAGYAATRIYRGATTTFADAVLVHTEYGAASAADSWADTGLAAGTYRYWGEPINASGVGGTRTGPITITI